MMEVLEMNIKKKAFPEFVLVISSWT